MEWRHDDLTVVDDRNAVDLEVVHGLLQHSYWAQGRPKEVVAKSLEHSLCFSVLKDGKQIGFARVVTDYAVFAWIADVMIAPEHRGHGAGKFLMQCVTEHPDVKHTMQILCTRDAHGLYEKYGFVRDDCMRKRP